MEKPADFNKKVDNLLNIPLKDGRMNIGKPSAQGIDGIFTTQMGCPYNISHCKEHYVKYVKFNEGYRDIVFENLTVDFSCKFSGARILTHHIDPYYTVCVPLKGKIISSEGGNRVLLDYKHFNVLNADSLQGIDLYIDKKNKLTRFLLIGFSRHFIKKILSTLEINFATEALKFNSKKAYLRNNALDNIVNMWIAELKSSEVFGRSLILNMLETSFLVFMLRSCDNTIMDKIKKQKINIGYDPRIKKAVNYLFDNYNKKVNLDELCNVAFLSKPHFLRLFKKNTKQTPVDFINRCRIEKAINLLKNSNYTIEHIATLTGYENVRYFYRIFKKYMGIMPSALRKNK